VTPEPTCIDDQRPLASLSALSEARERSGGWRSCTRPLYLIARLALAIAIVLGSLQLWSKSLIEPMIPMFRNAVEFIAWDFKVDTVEVVQHGSEEALRFRANLAAPISFRGGTVYPLGWGNAPKGRFQVLLSLGGLLGYVAMFSIIAIAWPSRCIRGYAWRLVLGLPLVATLLVIDVPFTVAAELWNYLYVHYAPNEVCVLMVWSRFMMGGGGYMIGILFAGITVALSSRLAVSQFTAKEGISPWQTTPDPEIDDAERF
jgi:hypothetical protein